jgi:luciferase family oxidoreductase group 1
MQLSVLDQSPVRQGGNAEDALAETIQLAQHAEQLGYHRFWVSEHHSTAAFAGSAPEILLAAIGAQTQRIRLGTGGIMLPHYSSYKIAEVGSLLATLFPNRIDLGLGRAAGADGATARELAADGRPRFERFPEQMKELIDKLANQQYRPKIFPRPQINPQVWMLGTSPDSARLAAELGLPYSFAMFINPEVSPQLFDYYRQHFAPSPTLEKPHSCLAINVFCADSEEKAQQLAHARQLAYLRVVTRRGFSGIGTIEEAEQFEFTDEELIFLQNHARHDAIGTPEQVKNKILALQKEYGADEIMVVTITHSFEDRKRSYTLLAEAFEL